nr:HAMP domain-containing sensor histidine kinase [Bacillus sp. FJAT-47783]
MALSSILAFVISNVYYHLHLKPANDKKITNVANDIVSFYENNPEAQMEEYFHHIGDLGYQIYVVNKDGHYAFYGGEFRNKKIDETIVQNVLNGQVYHGIAQFTSTLFITGFFDNEISNTIGMPITINEERYALFIRPNIEMQFWEMRIFFAVLLVLIILLSILFVTVSTRYVVKPITKLTEATKTIAKGYYNIELNVKRKDEIGQLSSHFSQMAKNLKQLEEMRQEFVSNVSHEIQSPLASIQGFSQTLQTEKITEEQRKHYLSIIESESRRMSLLSKQLLTLASLDKEEHLLEKKTFDIAAQIKQVVMMTEWQWRKKEIAIDLELPKILIRADENLLHQVWMNLITNSIKFTNQGGTISIRVAQEDEQCIVEIKDTGIGISKEDLPNIFNRFYKVDKARTRKEGGSGLGLAISKKIIDLHGGSIRAESELGKGTIFHVHLPRM